VRGWTGWRGEWKDWRTEWTESLSICLPTAATPRRIAKDGECGRKAGSELQMSGDKRVIEQVNNVKNRTKF
jgi:hypothetical protein